jgi:hypothetical protein
MRKEPRLPRHCGQARGAVLDRMRDMSAGHASSGSVGSCVSKAATYPSILVLGVDPLVRLDAQNSFSREEFKIEQAGLITFLEIADARSVVESGPSSLSRERHTSVHFPALAVCKNWLEPDCLSHQVNTAAKTTHP